MKRNARGKANVIDAGKRMTENAQIMQALRSRRAAVTSGQSKRARRSGWKQEVMG